MLVELCELIMDTFLEQTPTYNSPRFALSNELTPYILDESNDYVTINVHFGFMHLTTKSNAHHHVLGILTSL